MPPEPSKPPATALILPRVGGTPARLTFQGGRDPESPVHPLTETGFSPYSVVLSPDGRFAAVWLENRAIQIWRLAPIGLDWNVHAFPPPLNDGSVEGTLKGAEPVPPAKRTAPPPESGPPASSPPRRKVSLPSPIPEAPLGNNLPAPNPEDKPPRKRVHIQDSSAPGSTYMQPRRRIVLPESE